MYQESANVELKRELTDAVKSEIIAFLNTMNGTIYIGVEDDGTIYQPFLSLDQDVLDTKVANWIQDAIYPIPSYLINHYFNDDGVLVIEVKEGKDKPYFLTEKGPRSSGVFKRVGRSIRKVNKDEILRMIMISNDYMYEDDISKVQELTFKSLSRAFDENNLDLNERTMISFGIKRTDDVYTNLGYMLSDQSEVVVKIAEYDDHMNFKLKKQLKGCLINLFEDTKEQAERLNDVSAVIDVKSYKRKEIVSFPGAALREIILNAFCHTDYFMRSNIKIEFYKDKCIITSPGGIFNASLEDIMRGKQTYRNPKLVHIFDKLGLIENFGTGIPRTKEAYENEEVNPVFEASDHFFTVILPNLNYVKRESMNDKSDGNRLNVNGGLDDGLDDGLDGGLDDGLDDRIMYFLETNPNITQKELSDILLVSKRTVERAFKNLVDNHKIERIGGKRFGKWNILKR